jgi:mRNA-degrading endonuclease RelE of RelBE toxin-antitoxin system
MSFSIRTIPNFDKEFKKLYKKYPSLIGDFEKVLQEPTLNPQFGNSIGKSCFKIRLAISSKNKGKSGGARIITCVKIHDEVITLISVDDKSEQADIPSTILLQLLEEPQLI